MKVAAEVQNLTERIAEEIRSQLVKGVLSPGQRLSEAALSEALDISRNTLREVFRMLTKEGLLVHEPNKGVSVAVPSMASIIDIYRVRRMIECQALAQAYPMHPALTRMREAVESGQRHSEAEDWSEVGTANMAFHKAIVALAGQHGAVTIATNMAGRGTDIKLDDDAKAAGGLKIIGTERHESRRIDNQLRGRSGRQGDPGESKFYISLEDDLMRLFGSERLISMFNTLGIPEGQEIEHKALTNAIESAQKKIESNNYGIRKNLLEYDRVMSEQREIIYEERLRVLNGESMRDVIYKMITDITENCVDICINDDADISDWDFNELNTLLIPTIPLQPLTPERVKKPKKNSLKQQLKEEAVKLYEAKEAEFPEPEAIRELERVVLLKVIDRKWMDHIDDMEQLRQGVGLQAYGQRDPLVEYKMSGYEMFDEMTQNIREETVRLLFHIKIEQKVEREQQAKITGTNKDDSLPKGPVKRENAKVYPNDPCPCGSGKKYKNCCGRKA